jgi:hypothetical protein
MTDSALRRPLRSPGWWTPWLGVGALVAAVAAAIALPPTVLVGVVLLATISAGVALSRRDPASVLTLVLVLLLVVPEGDVVVGPLKSVGAPAVLVGLGALGVYWATPILHRGAFGPGIQPVRWLMWGYAFAMGTGIVAAYLRPVTALEAAGTQRAPIGVVAGIGIALLAADGLSDRERLDAVLQRLVFLATFEALLGFIQFLHPSFNLGFLQLPGLRTNNDAISGIRADFSRAHSTAAHPIEFAVLVSSLVPLALHYVRFARSRNAKVFFGVAIVVLLSSMPTTVARSGVVATAVGVGVYAVEWSNRGRLNALALGLIGGGIFRATFPGLLGTLKSLFFVGTKDPSISSRTDTYAQLPGLLSGHWFIGRGIGTFQPAQYFFLDNQYLGTLLEEGIVGILAMVAILVGGMCLARGARKWSLDPATRSLGQAIAASLAALTATAATFDEFGFRQTFFVVLLLVGCAGALWKMGRTDPDELNTRSFTPAQSHAA